MLNKAISPAREPFAIAVLLLPAFNSLACNAFLDPLRAANYLHGAALFRWDFMSLNGGSVAASNGMSISETSAFKAMHQYDYVLVNVSWAPEKYRQRKLLRELHRAASLGCVLIALDTAAFVLAYAGLLDGYETVVHNEHEDAFRELFPAINLRSELFVIDRDRLSSVGGFAAADLSLELLHRHYGLDIANAAARYVFKERLREGSESSSSPPFEPIGYALPDHLREIILLMQRNLEEPLSIADLAHYAGYSNRQLCRLFKKYTGQPPVRYYLGLRLLRARGLLTQTGLSIAEVANACGFNSKEQFSRCYKQQFAVPPGKDRTSARIPFHFRSNLGPGTVETNQAS